MDDEVAIFREISAHLQKTLEEERELKNTYSTREAAHKESMGRERALQNLEVEALTRRLQRRAKQIAVERNTNSRRATMASTNPYSSRGHAGTEDTTAALSSKPSSRNRNRSLTRAPSRERVVGDLEARLLPSSAGQT
eukprot:CAMPEP_0178997660 /NCGR_PEP_ID=MMETSP0795-20121207/9079_1 /TAXON_ID=88552 /ORGANISM="Amoebophrya sp., Strain Ameob2" /LENGTH=137 /DNA_ID=CAMNT_0020690249 /DNA_START=78 /DNA_END=491 /DNA_ORIENTATION=+